LRRDRMKFKCEIDNIKTLKKGMKITLTIDNKQTIEVMKHIYNFMDKPIIVELLIDEKEQKERLKQITPEQRKKIYAILRDIEAYTGENVESLKEDTKASFIRATGYEDFSLSNCSKELAAAYIEYLIRLAFELGVPLSENPIECIEDIENYLKLCLDKRICVVCGRPGEVHHVDVIGMGRDRETYDDSNHRKMCLCRKHHSEAHQIGMDAFQGKYHVYGIIWEG
jgi:hypothetical protein